MKINIFFLTCFIIASACNRNNDYSYLDARLGNLVDPGSAHGGSIKSDHITLFAQDNGLKLAADSTIANLTFKPFLIELPNTWDAYRWLEVDYENTGNDTATLIFKIFGAKNLITDTVISATGTSISRKIPLRELPLANKRQNYYMVENLSVELHSEKPAMEYLIKRIALISNSDSIHEAVVDRFGQRLHADWPKKVKSIGQLVESRINEETDLQTYHTNPKLDRFGGMTGFMHFDATGFFRLQKVNTGEEEKWWFITPDGNPFWSLGVTCVRPKYPRTAVTKVKDVDYLFKKLPEHEGEESDAYIGDSLVSFYYWNLIRKYGSMEEWHETMFQRLQYWGLNTIGNWSVKEILLKSDIPFTYSFRTTENREYSYRGGVSDVFNPGWQDYVKEVFKEALEFKDNPYLIGYFVDNEAGWGNLKILDVLPADCATRKAWQEFLENKYRTTGELNNTWNSSFNDWIEVRNMQPLNENTNHTYHDDIIMFESMYADMYFSTIKNTLSGYDPNHLYLGCRFTKRLKPEHILRAAGKYCDVITVNVYDLVPVVERMDKWHEYTGRPILIGEHHLPLLSNRQLPPHYRAFTSGQRFTYYQEYVKTWAEQPYALGCHWYQLADQHITGRYSNGENQIIGLVDITDQPYPEMVKAIKISSMNIYRWHGR